MKNGFTLIEVMIVIIILASLGIIFAGQFAGNDILNETYVRDCIMEKELSAIECQINADTLYPKEQSQINSGTPSPQR